MPIDIYSYKYSPPCVAVLLTAKELKIELNVKIVDLSKGEQFNEDFLKMNPAHTIPVIDDNGFVLWESRAIMQYLCNKYAPGSSLYPSDPKMRAVVDRWLNFDLGLFTTLRQAVALPLFGIPASEQTLKALKDLLKLTDQLIGNKKYLVSDHFTIADLSVLSSTSSAVKFGYDFTDYPNFKRWVEDLKSELPYYNEVDSYTHAEMLAHIDKIRSSAIVKS